MTDDNSNPSADRAGQYPAARRGWYTVAVLVFAYALLLADRQIIAFLVDPIREDLVISDFQFSVITGFIVVSISALLGIPLARYSDSRNRLDIIAISVALWTLMTVLCSRASGLFLLLIARFGNGLARAVIVPASVSLIADSFPPAQRPLAINVHAAGAFAGLGVAHLLSGFLVAAATTAEGLRLPLTGVFSAWQLAFVFVALLGVVVLVLMRRMDEPERQEPPGIIPEARRDDVAGYVRKNWFVFTSLVVGAVLSGIGLFAVFAWGPAVFSRVFGWSGMEIGLTFGLLTIVSGIAGLYMSGRYATQFVSEGQTFVFQRLMMLAIACGIIPGAITLTADSAWLMWLCFAGVIFFLAMPVGLVQTAIQAITPNGMRAQIVAVYLAMLNFAGLGLGPVAVAFVTDFILRDEAAIGRSIGIVIVTSGVASVLLLALGVKQYEEMGRDR